MLAIQKGMKSTIVKLLTTDLDLTATNAQGMTALMLALKEATNCGFAPGLKWEEIPPGKPMGFEI